MSEPSDGQTDQALCPRRRDDVALHEVASTREGTRTVLVDGPRGVYFDLPLGEQDAFVWARFDGETSLKAIARAYLEEYDSIHPDLAGLTERLRAAGLLAGEAPPVRSQPPALGARLARLAAALAMIRIPIPLSQPLWRAIGRAAAPLYATPVGALGALVGLVGLAIALAAPATLTAPRTPLLQWPTADGGSLLVGLLALLALNAAVDLFEAVAQVAVLARGGRPPGRIGLSFDLGVPGIYIETPDSILLPLERRVRLFLSPLFSAGFVAGVATAALWRLGWDAPTPLAPVLLHKLAWVAWLRCAVHLNPLTPSPLYDALCAWWNLPRLRGLAWSTLRRGGQPGGDGPSRRELLVLVYLGLVVAYLVLGARLGAVLLWGELLPAWGEALATGDPAHVGVLAVLLAALGVPTLLGLAGGVLFSLQAGARALAGTELLRTPGRSAVTLGAASLALAAAPILAGALGAEQPLQLGLTVCAALLGLAAVAAAGRLASSGAAPGGGAALTTSAAALTALWVVLVTSRAGSPGLLAAGLWAGAGAAAGAWALTEISRWLRGGVALRAAVATAALLAVAGAATRGASPVESATLAGLALFGSSALGTAASCWQARGGHRLAGLALLEVALLVLSAAGAAWWRAGQTGLAPLLPAGAHLPVLASGLLAAGAWLLATAHGAPRGLPAASRALGGTTPDQHAARAAAFVVEGLQRGLRAGFGRGVAQAAARELATAGLEGFGGDDPPRLSAQDGDADEANHWRTAAAAACRVTRQRCGAPFLSAVLSDVVARLPAVAHEQLDADGPPPLPAPLGEARAVPAPERQRLLRSVVQLTDFGDDVLAELADWVGLRRAQPGEVLVRQGELGDRFYVVASGQARVLVETGTGEEVAVATLRSGDAFGEAALLSHEPRSASVVAEQSSLLLTLEREAFAAFMQRHTDLLPRVFARQEDLDLVRQVPLFADLSGAQVAVLCRRFAALEADPGDAVIRQGEAGDRFYLIREGAVEVVHAGGEGGAEAGERVVAQLGRGDYFGEIALLEDSPRTATVRAKQPTELLALEREDFRSLIAGAAGRELARRSQRRKDALGDRANGGTP